MHTDMLLSGVHTCRPWACVFSFYFTSCERLPCPSCSRVAKCDGSAPSVVRRHGCCQATMNVTGRQLLLCRSSSRCLRSMLVSTPGPVRRDAPHAHIIIAAAAGRRCQHLAPPLLLRRLQRALMLAELAAAAAAVRQQPAQQQAWPALLVAELAPAVRRQPVQLQARPPLPAGQQSRRAQAQAAPSRGAAGSSGTTAVVQQHMRMLQVRSRLPLPPGARGCRLRRPAGGCAARTLVCQTSQPSA